MAETGSIILAIDNSNLSPKNDSPNKAFVLNMEIA